MQLDLFADGRSVMLRNDVIAAVRMRDVAAARQALAVLSGEYPGDGLLAPTAALLHTLDRPVERFSHHSEAAEALRDMDAVVIPAATLVFGAANARDWLSSIWRSLADAAADLRYRVETSHAHAAFMSLQGGDWAAAEARVATIPSWRRIPLPLAWMAEARFGRLGLESAWCLLVELAWTDATRFGAVAGRLGAPALRKLLDDFDAGFEPDEQADLAWFPAWALIAEPALAIVFRETQVCSDSAPERAARLVMELLTLERQGRHADLIIQRKRLRDLHVGLFNRYMATR
jgi:hypothetical protein